jgi:hypothetical protein
MLFYVTLSFLAIRAITSSLMFTPSLHFSTVLIVMNDYAVNLAIKNITKFYFLMFKWRYGSCV